MSYLHSHTVTDAQGRELTKEEADAVREQLGFVIIYDECTHYTDEEWREISAKLNARCGGGKTLAARAWVRDKNNLK